MEKIFKRGEKEITALSWDANFSCGGRQEKLGNKCRYRFTVCLSIPCGMH